MAINRAGFSEERLISRLLLLPGFSEIFNYIIGFCQERLENA